METFDAIVVGAGAAGCVVARRLADDGLRTLLLEAGPGRPPAALTSPDAVEALTVEEWFWPGLRASVDLGNEAVAYRRGRGLGGSTAVNTLVATPGDPRDYDRWGSDFACPGWDWARVGPFMTKTIEDLRPVAANRGPLAGALEPIVAARGHAVGGTSAEPGRVGLLAAALTIDGGRRRSAAEVYLSDPPATLEIRTGSTVARVEVANGRAVGVVLEDRSVVSAGRVVLCAGALATPVLLARSGIDHPGIGTGAEDHPSFVFTVALPPTHRQRSDRPVAPVSSVLRWRSADHGPAGRFEGAGADLLAVVMDHVGAGVDGRRHGAVIVTLTDVRSRGTVPVVGGGAGSVLSPGWLRDPSDRRRLADGVRHLGQILGPAGLGSTVDGVFLDDRGTPISELDSMSDVDLEHWLANHPGPVSHLAATCPLGSGERSPLGPDGGVVGCDGLWVADASALPHLPNANPQLPVMALAEALVAGLVRGADRRG